MTNDLHTDNQFDDSDDGDIRTLVRSAGLETEAGYVADLRATLRAEADGANNDGAAVVTLTADAPDSRERTARRWPMLAAAAAVGALGIGAIALVAQPDDDPPVISDDNGPELGNTVDDPVAFLDGETWVAVRRFDVYPSARTPMFTANAARPEVGIDGFDGCLTGWSQTLGFLDGAVDRIAVPATIQPPCLDDQATRFAWTVGDQLSETERGFVVVHEGQPAIEFARLSELPAATANDLIGQWLLDRLATLTIDADRLTVGFWGCVNATGYTWDVVNGELIVDGLHDDVRERCDPPSSEFLLDGADDRIDLAELLVGPARAVRVDEHVVLVGADRAITLRPIAVVPADPTGIIVANGAAFGVTPAVGIGPDDVLAATVPQLGDPTFDSGWVDVPRTVRVVCSEAPNEYRELHWDDLSFGFWRRGGRVSFHYWIVGDRDELFFDTPDVSAPQDPPASGLATELGVVVGDSTSFVVGPGTYRQTFDDGMTVRISAVSADGGGIYRAIDDRITAIFSVNEGC